MLKKRARRRCARCSIPDDHSAQILLTKHNQRLVGVEDALLGPLDRPLRREVLLGEALSDGGVGEPGGLVGLGRGAALRGQVPDPHLLRHAQQVLPAFLWVSGTLPGRGWHKRWQGYWHAW